MDSSSESHQVTLLLRRWREGDHESLDALVPLVETELRGIARRHMRRERHGHTLQTTALVNEAYLRLVGNVDVEFSSRAHFLAIAARVMRQILVDYARRSRSAKRDGGVEALPLDEALLFSTLRSAHLLALDAALESLAKLDTRKSQVVELRYFGGLDVKETAQTLQVSPNTVIRDWALAKAWLKREMESLDGHGR